MVANTLMDTDLSPAAVEQSEDRQDFDAFYAEGNARERLGAAPAVVPSPVVATEDVTAAADAVAAGEPLTVPAGDDPAAPPVLDKRTREGRKQSVQQEIDALTATKHATAREVEAARLELARLEGQKAALAAPKPAPLAAPVATDDPEPLIAAFADADDPYTAWLRASQKWDTRQELRQYEAKQVARSQQLRDQQASQQREAAHVARFDAAVAADPTFKATLTPEMIALRPVSALGPDDHATAANVIGEEILRSSHGPQLMAHFSTHPDDFRRLATLPTGMTPADHGWQIIREMAKLELRLTAALPSSPASSPRVISAAKPPLKLVGTSSTVSDDDVDEGELPIDEYIRRGNTREQIALPRQLHR